MSKIEVNTIEPQCGTTLTVGAAGTNVAVPSNVVKSNALQASDAGNIISQSGTTVTLGASGDTIALASGATQTGFGRTGTVDWDTSIKTGTVTAVTGKGYFVDTTSGGITVNLPAAAVGSIVAVSDYASTAASNNITISPNGSEKINAVNDVYTISTAGLAVTLVYADATRGWKSVTGSDADAVGVVPVYITATGGTPCSGAIVCTNYKTHTFTGPGTFCVSAGAGTLATADYLMIGGGGGGASRYHGGGGGAGGYRESSGADSGCYTASPLGAGVSGLSLSVQSYPITVGGGGTGGPNSPPNNPGTKGNDSIFSTRTSTGGGLGGTFGGSGGPGGSGGAGGGGPSPGGTGNSPAVSPAQGTDGGDGDSQGGVGAGGGAGGATVAGTNSSGGGGGAGGAGATTSIDATPTVRAGGGGGAGYPSGGAAGGTGGGGTGTSGGIGTVNTGSGGGGGGGGVAGGGGGSGIVIIRYKFQ